VKTKTKDTKSKSKKKKKKKHNRKKTKKLSYSRQSHTKKRITESQEKKNTIALNIIKRARKQLFRFKYVLWDSWYNCSVAYKYVFTKLVPKGVHLISMLKLSKETYTYGDDDATSLELTIKQLEKVAGIWQYLSPKGIKYKEITVWLTDKSSKKVNGKRKRIGAVKLCFYKFPKQKGFNAILCTDVKLCAEEVLKQYLRHWSIEVMIKDLKQHFGFNNCMASKYSTEVAQMTIKCILYVMVCSVKERKKHKSVYCILFELQTTIQTCYLEMLSIFVFKKNMKEFLIFAQTRGINDINELIKMCDYIVDDFFKPRDYVDRIMEVA
jgi:hypothetical protein